MAISICIQILHLIFPLWQYYRDCNLLAAWVWACWTGSFVHTICPVCWCSWSSIVPGGATVQVHLSLMVSVQCFQSKMTKAFEPIIIHILSSNTVFHICNHVTLQKLLLWILYVFNFIYNSWPADLMVLSLCNCLRERLNSKKLPVESITH